MPKRQSIITKGLTMKNLSILPRAGRGMTKITENEMTKRVRNDCLLAEGGDDCPLVDGILGNEGI